MPKDCNSSESLPHSRCGSGLRAGDLQERGEWSPIPRAYSHQVEVRLAPVLDEGTRRVPAHASIDLFQVRPTRAARRDEISLVGASGIQTSQVLRLDGAAQRTPQSRMTPGATAQVACEPSLA